MAHFAVTAVCDTDGSSIPVLSIRGLWSAFQGSVAVPWMQRHVVKGPEDGLAAPLSVGLPPPVQPKHEALVLLFWTNFLF